MKKKYILFWILLVAITSIIALFLWGSLEIAHENFLLPFRGPAMIAYSEEINENWRQKELYKKIILAAYLIINLIPIIGYLKERKK